MKNFKTITVRGIVEVGTSSFISHIDCEFIPSEIQLKYVTFSSDLEYTDPVVISSDLIPSSDHVLMIFPDTILSYYNSCDIRFNNYNRPINSDYKFEIKDFSGNLVNKDTADAYIGLTFTFIE